MASRAQIATKAALKPAGDNRAWKAIQQRPHPNHALVGILDTLVPLFKRRITSIGLCRVFPKVG
jgi:hypothetical protein